ncbi:MAG TPA: DUF2157 domain-containing protein [Flavobacteriales bacterium]|nr:DUF2157 domain-containing protein [Flavobacteriales bacterium]HRE98091.1 DUF2157 domain-containing protein [Flavobacteriales bacterium]HRJ34893.1 DUF2157 domain-containing protein [Flavobacteriales bacterium]HRJ39467.1 DUF2157 domain-containing protein [Flavobacteriales bacterium]
MITNRTVRQLTLIVVGILATFSIGGGIIALLAHNWDDFPKVVRIILSFIPAILGIATFLYSESKYRDSLTWAECSSVFLALMIGSTIGLVAQVYNMGGSFEDFLFVWLVMILPIIYLGNSSATAIFYIGLSLTWLYLTYLNSFRFFFGFGSGAGNDVLWFWILFLGVVPHLRYHLQPGRISFRGVTLGWSVAIALCMAAFIGFSGHRLINSTLLITLVYYIGKEYFGNGNSAWQRPFQSISILSIFLMTLIYSGHGLLRFTLERDGYIQSYYGAFDREWQGEGIPATPYFYYFNLVLLFAMAFGAGYFFWREKERNSDYNKAILVFPGMILLAILLQLFEFETTTRILINLYLLFMAWWYLREGWRMRLGWLVFFAALVFSTTMIGRYFDMDIPFWIKGMMYLGLGAGLLWFNKIYSEEKA